MMKCFTEGVCTPDVAEIVKPFIFMSVLEIGAEQDIDDIVMFNDKEDSSELTPEIKLQMMKKFKIVGQSGLLDGNRLFVLMII